jgi:hypothetical protein
VDLLLNSAADQVQQPCPGSPLRVEGKGDLANQLLGPLASTGKVLVWCQMCSSTPTLITPSKRVSSAAICSSSGWIEDHAVFRVVPNCGARPSIEAFSRLS